MPAQAKMNIRKSPGLPGRGGRGTISYLSSCSVLLFGPKRKKFSRGKKKQMDAVGRCLRVFPCPWSPSERTAKGKYSAAAVDTAFCVGGKFRLAGQSVRILLLLQSYRRTTTRLSPSSVTRVVTRR